MCENSEENLRCYDTWIFTTESFEILLTIAINIHAVLGNLFFCFDLPLVFKKTLLARYE